jgi:hypothetical protein
MSVVAPVKPYLKYAMEMR